MSPSAIESQQTISPRRINITDTFAALRYPNYRLWFYGQMISLMGTWMQATAQGFLVFELTRSSVYLGYVGFASGVPAWLFTLYGGFIADRIQRRNLLIMTQTSMMILAFILAGLTFLGIVQPWHIIALSFLLGVTNAFDAPARQAFVLEMVPREDLTNAVALNATMFNTGTAFGPAIAGITYAMFGPAWCFIINGVSFIAIIAALAMMKLNTLPLDQSQKSVFQGIREGYRFVRTDVTVRTLILYLAAVSLFGMGFVTLMPDWAVKILGGDATTNGLLQSSRGIGALIGALLTAVLSRMELRGRLVTWGSFLFPLTLIVFGLIHWLPLSMLVLVIIGISQIVYMNNSNSLVQTETPDHLRGRVLSIYTLAFFGLMPVGSLLVGVLAAAIGEVNTLIFGALLLFICAIWMRIKVPEIRQSA